MRMKASTLATLTALLLGILVVPQANGFKGVTYTLTSPFQYAYEEDGPLKPPVRLTQADRRFATNSNCNFILGEKPVVEIMIASGKRIAIETRMKPAHKLSTTTWIKDENGENKLLVRGTCTYIGVITKNLPASNFYQFSAYASGRQGVWSYPYTLKQLSAMKGGIKETRFLDDLRTPGAFTPVPEIETPQFKPLGCSPGKLNYFGQSNEGDEQAAQGEDVQAVYLMVTNGIYRLMSRVFMSPIVEQLGERVQSHEDYSVDVGQLTNIELISENTPAFVTWRKPGEKNFSTSVKISYMTSAAAEVTKIAREKTFTVQVAEDCKTVTVTTP